MRVTKRSRSRGGFTLTELMITCALIGTMAAIAVPNFLTYQARTRRSEGMSNVAGIAKAYKIYQADRGNYPDMVANAGVASLPDPSLYGGLSPQKMPWDNQTESFFRLTGWKPEGNVYYTYDVNSSTCTGGNGACTDETCFTVTAHGDVDGQNGIGQVMFVHPMTNAGGTPIAWCNSKIANFPPPVRAGTSNSVFDEPAVRLGAGSDLY
jgi:prepilin-type N-terminal cleavage/methylation domain-containing protein